MDERRERAIELLFRAIERLRASEAPFEVRSAVLDAVVELDALEREGPDQKFAYVMARRKQGATYAKIAGELGLSTERVRVLELKGKRLQREAEDDAKEGPLTLESSVDRLALPVRVQRVLENAEIGTIGELLEFDERRLLRLKNCGQEAVLEIRVALRRHGLLSDLPKEQRSRDSSAG